MLFLAFIFWTASVASFLMIASFYIGNWISREKTKINNKNSVDLFFMSVSWGSLFFNMEHQNWSWTFIFFIASIISIIPIFKDWIVLYSEEVWTLPIKDIKRIITYYNPRFYWMLFCFILFTIMFLLNDIHSLVFWEILGIIIFTYYAGMLSLSKIMKNYNLMVLGINENEWEGFNQEKSFFKYGNIISFRIQGIKSNEKIKELEKENIPEYYQMKIKMCLMYYDNINIFIEAIEKKDSLISYFSIKELAYVLYNNIGKEDCFERIWKALPNNVKEEEEIIWIKITKDYNQGNLSAVESLIYKVERTEHVEEILEEIYQQKINKIQNFSYISTNINDYEITENDYLRNSSNDKLFLKKYKMELYEIFSNSCVKNGSREEIEIDHFFIPKSKGGSFLMKRKDGIWVVNAIILNKKNNIIKGNGKIEDFFSIKELEVINYKLKQLCIKVNHELWSNA